MATTILTTDLELFTDAETGELGTWTGGKESDYDTATFIEGSGSRAYICNSGTVYDCVYTDTVSHNIGTSNVLRIWCMITDAFRTDTYANGGIRIVVGDGTNTAYFNYAGNDTYDGGWIQLILDTGSTPSSGTSPNWSAITKIGISLDYTFLGKNTETVWIDAIRYGNVINAYGGTSGDEIDIESIYQVDKANAYGIVWKEEATGVYSIRGELNIGDSASTNACYCSTFGKVMIGEDLEWIGADTIQINVVGNSTGVTDAEFSSCFIQSAGVPMQLDASDVNVDNLAIKGSTISNCYGIVFQSGQEILNTAFINCAQIDPSTSTFESNTISYSTDSGGSILFVDSWGVQSCNFLLNTNAIEIDDGDPAAKSFTALFFTGNTYDVNNTSGVSLTISKVSLSNPSTYTGTAVSFVASVSIDIHVQNEAGADIVGALVYIDEDLETAGSIFNDVTDSNGDISTSYSGVATSATVRVRKYGYKPNNGVISLTADSTGTVIMINDPQQT